MEDQRSGAVLSARQPRRSCHSLDTAVGVNSKQEAATDAEKTLLEWTNVPLQFGQLTQDARVYTLHTLVHRPTI